MNLSEYSEEVHCGFEPKGLSYSIIGAAIEVHKNLGPGLLEAVYENCLAFEFVERKLNFERQRSFPVKYKTIQIDGGYRLDFLIENSIVLELKAVEKILPVHEAQLMTYLKLSRARIGLLINFNVQSLNQGITRIVL